MYLDNAYASSYRAPTPVYDKAHFIAKFSAIPEDRWCRHDFTDAEGRHCAIGHLMKPDAFDWQNEESLALGALLNPENPVQGASTLAKINDDAFGMYGYDYGTTPKARVLNVLHQLPDPVTTDIRRTLGVEEVRVAMKRPAPVNIWEIDQSKLDYTYSGSFMVKVSPEFWKQPVLQP